MWYMNLSANLPSCLVTLCALRLSSICCLMGYSIGWRRKWFCTLATIFIVSVVLMNVGAQLLFGIEYIFWATRPNRRAFFTLVFLLRMSPVVVLKQSIFFETFWLLATNIIQCYSAVRFSLHLEVILNVFPNFYPY